LPSSCSAPSGSFRGSGPLDVPILLVRSFARQPSRVFRLCRPLIAGPGGRDLVLNVNGRPEARRVKLRAVLHRCRSVGARIAAAGTRHAIEMGQAECWRRLKSTIAYRASFDRVQIAPSDMREGIAIGAAHVRHVPKLESTRPKP
jgi:hypothetical protein